MMILDGDGSLFKSLSDENKQLKNEIENLKSNMLLMRSRIKGKSVSMRCLKIIDECLVKSSVMKEEESIQWQLYGKRILKGS